MGKGEHEVALNGLHGIEVKQLGVNEKKMRKNMKRVMRIYRIIRFINIRPNAISNSDGTVQGYKTSQICRAMVSVTPSDQIMEMAVALEVVHISKTNFFQSTLMINKRSISHLKILFLHVVIYNFQIVKSPLHDIPLVCTKFAPYQRNLPALATVTVIQVTELTVPVAVTSDSARARRAVAFPVTLPRPSPPSPLPLVETTLVLPSRIADLLSTPPVRVPTNRWPTVTSPPRKTDQALPLVPASPTKFLRALAIRCRDLALAASLS